MVDLWTIFFLSRIKYKHQIEKQKVNSACQVQFSLLFYSFHTNVNGKGQNSSFTSDGLSLLPWGGNQTTRRKTLNSKPGLALPDYLAQDTSLLPWVQYMWCLYDPNKLQDLEEDAKHQKDWKYKSHSESNAFYFTVLAKLFPANTERCITEYLFTGKKNCNLASFSLF